MINQIYVIFDKVAMESGPIFEAKNDGVAHRHYSKMMESVGKDYSEFKMVKLGQINHENNQIDVFPVQEEIIANMTMEEDNE